MSLPLGFKNRARRARLQFRSACGQADGGEASARRALYRRCGSEAERERHSAVEAGWGEGRQVGAMAARRRKVATVSSQPDHRSGALQRIVRLCDQSFICWFQVARTAAKSAAPSTPRRRRKIVFSAVTSRSRRATEGLSSPAAFQSCRVTSSGPARLTEVTRQITASC